nr:glucose-methanol-choline oxidoreductase, FAD/NAD(P)-binding domain protein [Tanacetum cinerariifolium]
MPRAKLHELFHYCKQYGHVVDTYIPDKRTKLGKRFGFARFINVFNVDRLVSNLCTIWVERFKLHANAARFQRPLSQKGTSVDKKYTVLNKEPPEAARNVVREVHSNHSYVNVVKSKSSPGVGDVTSSPALVIDDDCLNPNDISNALLGRVKDIASLSNLKMALLNEGFVELTIRYMGELWILLEFPSSEAKELFKNNVGAGSWFSVLKQASMDFNIDGRISWVEIEGLLLRAKEVPGWVPELLEDSDDENDLEDGEIEVGSLPGDFKDQDSGSNGDNSDIEAVPDSFFDESSETKKEQSADPFHIYSLFNRNNNVNSEKNNSDGASLEYPPGYTPPVDQVDLGTNGVKSQSFNLENNHMGKDGVRNSTESKEESVCSGRFKNSAASRSGGSFLSLMEEVVKVGQTMGYNMGGCENNFNSVGNSGGILCVWDPEFKKLFFLQFFSRAEQEHLKREYHSIRQTDTETSTKFIQRFLRLVGFLGAAAGTAEEQAKNFQWGLRRSTLNHLMCMPFTDVAQVANAARNYEILHERDDDDAERPDKRYIPMTRISILYEGYVISTNTQEMDE